MKESGSQEVQNLLLKHKLPTFCLVSEDGSNINDFYPMARENCSIINQLKIVQAA